MTQTVSQAARELLPDFAACPFCRSTWVRINRPANGSQSAVKCCSCNATGPFTAGMSDAEIAAAWNQRAGEREPAPSSEREMLAEARELMFRADQRVPWESWGLGNTFAERFEEHIARIDTYLATTQEPALDLHTLEEVDELRFWLRKAGEVLAPHSADAPGTPTRDALVFVNAGLNRQARETVRRALKGGEQ